MAASVEGLGFRALGFRVPFFETNSGLSLEL